MDLYEKLLITGVIIRLADVAPKEEGTEECYEHAAYPVLMEISVHDYNTLMLYLHWQKQHVHINTMHFVFFAQPLDKSATMNEKSQQLMEWWFYIFGNNLLIV